MKRRKNHRNVVVLKLSLVKCIVPCSPQIKQPAANGVLYECELPQPPRRFWFWFFSSRHWLQLRRHETRGVGNVGDATDTFRMARHHQRVP
jgi:hypothetical protein